MTRELEGTAKRLCAYVGEDELYDDKPLYQALVDQARAQGCAGATALRGMAGFGATSRDVAKHGLRMSTDRPVLVTAIDEPQRVAALAEVWSAMVPCGLVTIEDINVVRYAGRCADDDSALDASAPSS